MNILFESIITNNKAIFKDNLNDDNLSKEIIMKVIKYNNRSFFDILINIKKFSDFVNLDLLYFSLKCEDYFSDYLLNEYRELFISLLKDKEVDIAQKTNLNFLSFCYSYVFSDKIFEKYISESLSNHKLNINTFELILNSKYQKLVFKQSIMKNILSKTNNNEIINLIVNHELYQHNEEHFDIAFNNTNLEFFNLLFSKYKLSTSKILNYFSLFSSKEETYFVSKILVNMIESDKFYSLISNKDIEKIESNYFKNKIFENRKKLRIANF